MALKDLIIDDKKASEELIESIIMDYVRIGQSSNNVIFTSLANSTLNNKQKVLVYLVARKAIKFLDQNQDFVEKVKPDIISKELHLVGATTRVILRRLAADGVIYSEKGEYFIPNHELIQIKSLISKKGE